MTSIKKIRELRKMTQSELAERINISTVSLSRYENGVRNPRATELSKMAEVLGCSVDELLRDDVNPTSSPSAKTGGETA